MLIIIDLAKIGYVESQPLRHWFSGSTIHCHSIGYPNILSTSNFLAGQNTNGFLTLEKQRIMFVYKFAGMSSREGQRASHGRMARFFGQSSTQQVVSEYEQVTAKKGRSQDDETATRADIYKLGKSALIFCKT